MPERTCLGCRRVRQASELLRLVSKAGVLTPDPDRRLPGRGAYLCPEEDCVKEAFRRKDAFSRALREKVEADERAVFDHIRGFKKK